MKTVNEIRSIISRISDAMYEAEPEEVERGLEKGIKTIWEEPGSSYKEPNLFIDSQRSEREEELYGIPQPIEEIFEYGAEVDEDMLVHAMDGSEGERIKKSVLVRGTDGLAWYVPFHCRGVQWGIYIPISSIIYMITNFFDKLNTDLWTKFKIAFRALHQHELFHFAVDYMSAQWEAIIERPCYNPARKLKKEYGYNLLEELVANAHMIRSFWRGKALLKVLGKTKALREFVNKQPIGYREAGQATDREKFLNKTEKLAHDYIECIKEFDPQYLDAVNINVLFPLFPDIEWRYCPVHILHDEQRIGISNIDLSLFREIFKIRETEDFLEVLRGLPKKIQKTWEKVKNRLAITTAAPGLDFKFWERKGDERIYSVRLSNSYRAHLVYSNTLKLWSATRIGTHKKMGHG